MATVTWSIDGNGNYLVSSPEHLVQIMHGGSKYTDEGDAPTNYSANSYLQTVDIDLAGYHRDIQPIIGFAATYDGGNHSIANWKYDFNGTDKAGFFQQLSGTGVFKNAKLTGVWKLSGDNVSKFGFVAGELHGCIDNVVANFEPGTAITGENITNIGGFTGQSYGGNAYISGCALNGTIELPVGISTCGGFVGYGHTINMSYCANYAHFPKGIVAKRCGGFIGQTFYLRQIHNLVNGIRGNIGDLEDTTRESGGIVGYLETRGSADTNPGPRLDTVVNCMIGDVVAGQYGYAGGIIGVGVRESLSMSKVANYMTGNILGPLGSGLLCHSTNSSLSITNSIVAMNGNVVKDTVIHGVPSTADIRVTVNTDFGLTFESNNYASTDALVDFVTDDVFTLLPYLPISGTSEKGTAVSFDPTFGNLSGLDSGNSLSSYQTLTIHTSPQIYYPYAVNMGFSDTNTTKYLTYGSFTSTKKILHVDDAITGPFTGDVDSVFNMTGTLMKGLTWNINGNSQYEVATTAHLLQLMFNGTLYDDFGGSPDFRSESFVQTSDIDLGSSDVTPIGSETAPFTGSYSGSSHSISSWKYDRGSPDDGSNIEIGLFGRISGGSVTDLVLTGTWSMAGSCDVHGLLVGKLVDSTASNVKATFSDGSALSSGHSTSSTCGLLIGSITGASTVSSLHAAGHMNYSGTDSVLGGVIGSLDGASSVSEVSTSLKTSLQSSDIAGGVIGKIGSGTLNAYELANNSVGNIEGVTCGGIVGSLSTEAMTRADIWVNSMTGDIVGSSCSGGIVGLFEALSADVTSLSKVINYMSGDITSSSSGGVFGSVVDSSSGAAPAIQCSNSVVGMNGTVGDTAVGSAGHTVNLTVTVNTDFGLNFTTNTHETSDPLTEFETFTDFPIPFLSVTGTSALFPNVKGAVETSPLYGYEVVIIHTSPVIYVPYSVTFDFVENTTKYIAYANVTKSELYVDPSLSVLSSSAPHTMDHDGTAKPGYLLPSITSTMYGSSGELHGFTDYENNTVRQILSSGFLTNVPSLTREDNRSVKNLGMVYNPHDQFVYYITDESGPYTWMNYRKVRKVSVDDGSSFDVHDEMIRYTTMVSDSSKKYIFGARDNGAEIFRMDIDGGNMITVRVRDLIGNTIVNGFASNRDDERIYFSDANPNTGLTRGAVYSLSWDLDDLQTMPFVIKNSGGKIYYYQGLIYFFNKNPVTGEDDSNVYAYDLAKSGFRQLDGLSLSEEGTVGRNCFHVHPASKALVITHSSGTTTRQGVNFDFHAEVFTVSEQYTDGYDFAWTPIEGATSYELSINGVTTTTTSSSFTSRGHADKALLDLQLSYSTDDTTFVPVKYGYYLIAVNAKYSETFKSLPWGNPNSATWADPYDDPEIAIICNVHTMYTFNVATKEVTSVSSRNMQRLERSPTTKDIIAHRINDPKLYNAGKYAIHITNDTLPAPFYTHSTGIKYIHCSYKGSIYLVDADQKIWSVGLDGSDPQLIVSTTSCNVVTTDIYSPEKLVYHDGRNLKYLNLSTNNTTDILTNNQFYMDLCVMNGVVYFSSRFSQVGRVQLDGTEIDLNSIGGYNYCFLVDTSRQKLLLVDTNQVTEYTSGSAPHPSLPADPSSMIVSVTPLGMRASWSPITDAISYKLGISTGADGENPVTIYYTTSDTDSLNYTHSLAEESTHTVYLTYDTSTETDLHSSSRTITIPAASTDAADYNKDFFRGDGGKFSFEKLSKRNLAALDAVMNDVFSTGDEITLALPTGKSVRTKFIKRGEAAPVEEALSLTLPFTSGSGSGQSVSLTLSDSSTVDIEYDESTEAITVGGEVYASGDSFVVDGKKVTVYDI